MTYGIIRVTYQQALGLREAIRPLSQPSNAPFDAVVQVILHENVLRLLVAFETSKNDDRRPLVLTRQDVLLINQFLSMQDGDWAQDVLKQARRALYELETGVFPAWREQVAKLWDSSVLEKTVEDANPSDTGAN